MWAFQQYFRSDVTSLAKQTLSAIGVEVAPEALLIGYYTGAASVDWPICIEPESGPFHPSSFEDIEQEGQRRYDASDMPSRRYSDPDSNKRLHEGALEGFRIDALTDTLNGLGESMNRLYFVGNPGEVDGFRVYPVLSVLASRWDGFPALSKEHSDGQFSTRRSLQHAVVAEILATAHRSLSKKVPPRGFEYRATEAPDVIRHGLSDFIRRIAAVHGNWDGSELTDAMNAVAAQPYEGRTGIGTVLVSKREHPAIQLGMEFRRPIRLSQTRSFRKALEMTGPDLSLVSDGVEAFGLGRLLSNYDTESESVYRLQVVGRGSWELNHEDMPLVRIDNGIASSPSPRIAKGKFMDTVERVFGVGAESETLWELTLAAAEQQHGTMLVIHSDASGESQRLGSQALAIEPKMIDAAMLSATSAIDGAILVAPDGLCHAVGVILDGTAVSGTGDSARGARYNSAVRYEHAARSNTCVIVIVSEDGMINLLPNLRRRVRKATVEQAVAELETSAAGEVDFAAAARASRHVESLSFYLSAAQCEVVNQARKRVEDEREREVLQAGRASITRIGFELLEPNEAMNTSYWLPES